MILYMSQKIIGFRTTEHSALEPDLLDLDFTIRALRLSFLAQYGILKTQPEKTEVYKTPPCNIK